MFERLTTPLRQLVARRRESATHVRRAVEHLRRKGIAQTLRRIRDGPQVPHEHHDYESWVERYDTLVPSDCAEIKVAVDSLMRSPLVSVVMPVYNSDPRHLSEAVRSVRDQCYPNWNLCIADDASTRPETEAELDQLLDADLRISVVRRTVHGGVAETLNTGMTEAVGEFIAFLDHADVLAPTALYAMAQMLDRNPDLDVLYSDEDGIDDDGRRFHPHFKPDYNPELLLAQNYFDHLTVVRRSLIEAVGGLRPELEDYGHDLVLRVIEATSPDRVAHLPYLLYHRRDQAEPTWQRVRWDIPDPLPEVTVVIPTRDNVAMLKTCVEGLVNRTDYNALRIVVADNDSSDPQTKAYLETLRGKPRTDVISAPGPFNYSAINNLAVEHVTTPLVLLLNDDIEVLRADWLREMVALLARDGVGAVGAKLYYADGSVQHAGIVLGIAGLVGHAHKYRPGDDVGYFGRLVLTQEVAAVTGACLLTQADLWRSLGGLDEDHLPVAFNDVDYCLRLREAGQRVVWAANAELRHHESISRGSDETPERAARLEQELAWMRQRWGPILSADPMYNPNLTNELENYALAYPPRVAAVWRS